MKHPTLCTDGFYHSGPYNCEEWHAGVHMRETRFDYWRFYENGNWVRCYRSEPGFDFWGFTQSLTPQEIESAKQDGTRQLEDGLPLFNAGTYLVEENTLTTRFEWRIPLHPAGAMVFESVGRWVLSDDLLRGCDENKQSELSFVRSSHQESKRN